MNDKKCPSYYQAATAIEKVNDELHAMASELYDLKCRIAYLETEIKGKEDKDNDN